jgi:hypothetical protein
VRVDYGPDAKAQLQDLGKITAGLLNWELRSLLDTRSFPEDFVPLKVRHEPPWWWVRLNSAYAAAVRMASPAELAAKHDYFGPRLVVGEILASEEDLRTIERRLIEQADDV